MNKIYYNFYKDGVFIGSGSCHSMYELRQIKLVYGSKGYIVK